MPYHLQSPTLFFHFHGLKFTFITIKLNRKVERLLPCATIGGAIMCSLTTILNSKFSAAPAWSLLCLSSDFTYTFPLMMLDYQQWQMYEPPNEGQFTVNRIQAHVFPNFWPLHSQITVAQYSEFLTNLINCFECKIDLVCQVLYNFLYYLSSQAVKSQGLL